MPRWLSVPHSSTLVRRQDPAACIALARLPIASLRWRRVLHQVQATPVHRRAVLEPGGEMAELSVPGDALRAQAHRSNQLVLVVGSAVADLAQRGFAGAAVPLVALSGAQGGRTRASPE